MLKLNASPFLGEKKRKKKFSQGCSLEIICLMYFGIVLF